MQFKTVTAHIKALGKADGLKDGEFEAIVGQCAGDAEIVQKGERLRQDLELDALLITRGEEGMTLIQAGRPAFHLPALCIHPADP